MGIRAGARDIWDDVTRGVADNRATQRKQFPKEGKVTEIPSYWT
jgi:hypothetical protein